ncbi:MULTISPECIES: type II toxin-antitoxin system VapC family toxin [Adlercreutzia]|uniref:PIN domain-containing protein n=1 Tax=Adlercreutzia caecimuris TaxID=671266 RepID=A0A4S4FY40_9ACTN|nr:MULTISPECIES: PIN domain-containing protein [Adlercreutzia]THG35969.1 PIN domain-containing protein [Adlercreutzia caecimuris]
MELMLDNNIVLDHIQRREPFYELSRRACLLGIVGEANTYISVSMLTDLFYLLRKDFGSNGAQDMLEHNLSFLKLVSVTPEDAAAALAARWNDLEDCLVARCAEKIGADYIITRNVRDFAQSRVEAITPEELFARLEQQGFVYEEIDW